MPRAAGRGKVSGDWGRVVIARKRFFWRRSAKHKAQSLREGARHKRQAWRARTVAGVAFGGVDAAGWGAHAARVPVWAARPNHCFPVCLFRRGEEDGWDEVFGGPPKTARQRRALPGGRRERRAPGPQGRPKIAHRFNGGFTMPGGPKPRRGERRRHPRRPFSFVPGGTCSVLARGPSDESLGYFLSPAGLGKWERRGRDGARP